MHPACQYGRELTTPACTRLAVHCLPDALPGAGWQATPLNLLLSRLPLRPDLRPLAVACAGALHGSPDVNTRSGSAQRLVPCCIARACSHAWAEVQQGNAGMWVRHGPCSMRMCASLRYVSSSGCQNMPAQLRQLYDGVHACRPRGLTLLLGPHPALRQHEAQLQ